MRSDLNLAPAEPERQSLLVGARGGLVLWLVGLLLVGTTYVALGYARTRDAGVPEHVRIEAAPGVEEPAAAVPPVVPARRAAVGRPTSTLVAAAPSRPRRPTRAARGPVRGKGLPAPAEEHAVPGLEDPPEPSEVEPENIGGEGGEVSVEDTPDAPSEEENDPHDPG